MPSSCSSCSTGAQAYQQAQQSVQQQFKPKSIAQYVKEAAEPPKEASGLNTSGPRGTQLNVSA